MMLDPLESIDWLFIRSFCEENEEFDQDLPLMIQDFLINEGARILEYSNYIYADDNFECCGALTGIRYKFLNMLLAAARHGSAYAAGMLCRIYKIYYRKEYNQLKRFKKLSYEELMAFDSEEELLATTAARILTVAPFMGIDVDPECSWVRDEIEEILEDECFGFKHVPEFLEFKEGVFPQAEEDARELLNRLKKANPNHYIDNCVQKFMMAVFHYNGVPSDFDILCEPEFSSDQREYAVTLAILRTVWPKRTFSDQEMEFYHGIYRLLMILIDHLEFLDEKIDLMLGRYDKFSYELEHSRYRPDGKNAVTAPYAVAGTSSSADTGGQREMGEKQPAKRKEEVEALYAEIEQLRAAIRGKDQTIGQLNRMYREASEREKQNRVDQELLEAGRAELAKLREAVFRMTEGDLAKTKVSETVMEEAIVGRKIAIVGGHDNWVGFLRERFPDWIYIKPGISNTVPESAIIHAEYLFFFTDTLSHSTYNKFLKVVRTHGIPFSYLHGTNIPETIRQVYECVSQTGRNDTASG